MAKISNQYMWNLNGTLSQESTFLDGELHSFNDLPAVTKYDATGKTYQA